MRQKLKILTYIRVSSLNLFKQNDIAPSCKEISKIMLIHIEYKIWNADSQIKKYILFTMSDLLYYKLITIKQQLFLHCTKYVKCVSICLVYVHIV